MRLRARPLAATVVLTAALFSTSGCLWDDAQGQSANDDSSSAPDKAKGSNIAAGEPKAAQQPRPGSEPLFHATSSTGGKFHEFDTAGGFMIRFACKGTGEATVSIGGGKKYQYACTAQAAEQHDELLVKDPGSHTYRVQVSTTDAASTWSVFLDRMRTR